MQQSGLTPEHLELIRLLRADGVDVEIEQRQSTITGMGYSGSGDHIGELAQGGIALDNEGNASLGAGGIGWQGVSNETAFPVAMTIGGLFVVAGILIAIASKFKRAWTGAGLAVGGFALMLLAHLFETQPELMAVAGILAIGLGGWFGWSEWKQAKAKQEAIDRAAQEHKALSIVTKAVEGSPEEVQAEVKKRVVGLGGLAVKDTITNAKVGA